MVVLLINEIGNVGSIAGLGKEVNNEFSFIPDLKYLWDMLISQPL